MDGEILCFVLRCAFRAEIGQEPVDFEELSNFNHLH